MNAKQFKLAADIAATRSLTLAEAYERLRRIGRRGTLPIPDDLTRTALTQRFADRVCRELLDEHKTDLPVRLGGPIWDEVWGLLDEFLDEYEALPPRNRDPEV